MNEKIDTLFGGNTIISGFDVVKETDTSVCITPGKAIVCGASIEEDSDSTIISIPDNLASLKEVYVVIEYAHDHKRANFKITNSITSNMALLAIITMQGGLIAKINNSQKTGQLNELSMVAKDLSTGILNTQYLSYSGSDITIENSINAKTQDIKIKGVTKQNLVQSANKEVYVSAEYETEEATYHKLTDTKDGYLDLNIKGLTLHNLTTEGVSGAFYKSNRQIFVGDNDMLKPDSVYTVIFKASNVVLDGIPSIPILLECAKYSQVGCVIAEVDTDGYYMGLAETGQLSEQHASYKRLAIKGYVNHWENALSETRTITISDIMVIEGDWTNFLTKHTKYIAGIESSTENENNAIEIISKGKNILPLEILRHEMTSVDISNQTLTVSVQTRKLIVSIKKI